MFYQRTSVLSEFNCSLLDRIQLETTPIHSENFAENASISTGRQEPYTWVSSAYRCGEKSYPRSMTSDRRCTKWITGDPALTLVEAHHTSDRLLMIWEARAVHTVFYQADTTETTTNAFSYQFVRMSCRMQLPPTHPPARAYRPLQVEGTVYLYTNLARQAHIIPSIIVCGRNHLGQM